METVKNLIWGEEKKEHEDKGEEELKEQMHREPVSGKLGNTEAGEPYDAGNIEPNIDAFSGETTRDTAKSIVASTKIEPHAPTTGTSADPESTIADTKIHPLASTTSTSLPDRTKTDDLTAKPAEVAHPSLAAGEGVSAAEGLEQPLPEGHQKYSIQSSEFPSASAQAPSSNTTEKTTRLEADQGAAAPGQAPTSDEFNRIEKDLKPSIEGSEPGYLEKKAIEGEANSAGEKIGKEGELQKETTGEGTREQYVKSSGMQAEGGDFKASAPGAGREADRLFAEKGVKKEGSADTSEDGESGASVARDDSGGDGKQKKTLKEKLHDGKEKVLEKLHKH